MSGPTTDPSVDPDEVEVMVSSLNAKAMGEYMKATRSQVSELREQLDKLAAAYGAQQHRVAALESTVGMLRAGAAGSGSTARAS